MTGLPFIVTDLFEHDLDVLVEWIVLDDKLGSCSYSYSYSCSWGVDGIEVVVVDCVGFGALIYSHLRLPLLLHFPSMY